MCVLSKMYKKPGRISVHFSLIFVQNHGKQTQIFSEIPDVPLSKSRESFCAEKSMRTEKSGGRLISFS